MVDGGKMRVLANWGAERIASFPDLPTFKERGYKDVEFYIWAGLFAQSALPEPIMTRLREAMAEAVKSPEVIKTFETAGSPVAYMDAPEFAKFVATDSARLVAAVKRIGRVDSNSTLIKRAFARLAHVLLFDTNHSRPH